MKKKTAIKSDGERGKGKHKDPDIPENPGLLTFPHTIGSAVIKPEDLGKTKGRALTAMRQQTNKQMTQIFEQIHLLARQARDIRKRIEISEKIYRAQAGFEPIIGNTYFLYLKEDESNVLSMISPAEWGKSMPYKKYISAIKLLADHTWEVLDVEADL